MTAERDTLALTEAEREFREQGALCPDCDHRVTWHHDTRGCMYFGASKDSRCDCRLSSDAAVERIVADRVRQARAEALREVANEWSDRWVKEGLHHGVPGCYSPGYEHDLRRRADRIEADREAGA